MYTVKVPGEDECIVEVLFYGCGKEKKITLPWVGEDAGSYGWFEKIVAGPRCWERW